MQVDPKIKFKQERELGEVLSDTFAFIRQNFKALFKVILKVMTPVFVVMLVAFVAYYFLAFRDLNQLFDLIGSSTITGEFPTRFGFSVFLGSFVFLVISILFYAVYFATINYSIQSYIETGEIDIQEVSGKVWKKWSGFFGLTFMSTMLMVIGFVLCFVPGIYLMVPLSIVFSVMAFEGFNATESIRYSLKLIRHNWWISFFTLFIIGLIYYLGSSLFQIPAMIYALVQTFTMAQEISGDFNVLDIYNLPYFILTLIGALARFVLYGIVIIATVFIYFNLNEKHNQTGAFESIEKLGEQHAE